MSETNQTEGSKPRLVGINHIAIEVGDIDQALDFYSKIFDFKLRAKRPGNACIELGDQYINMMQTADPHEDRRRHFGPKLEVEDFAVEIEGLVDVTDLDRDVVDAD